MEIKHDAFISYNHDADHKLAEALEAGMEKLAKPLFSLRAVDVFRDTTGLAANSDLWGEIERVALSTIGTVAAQLTQSNQVNPPVSIPRSGPSHPR